MEIQQSQFWPCSARMGLSTTSSTSSATGGSTSTAQWWVEWVELELQLHIWNCHIQAQDLYYINDAFNEALAANTKP